MLRLHIAAGCDPLPHRHDGDEHLGACRVERRVNQRYYASRFAWVQRSAGDALGVLGADEVRACLHREPHALVMQRRINVRTVWMERRHGSAKEPPPTQQLDATDGAYLVVLAAQHLMLVVDGEVRLAVVVT